DQGIFAYWIHSWLRQRPLKYIGFGGHGHQVRDCLHPRDLWPVLTKQLAAPRLPSADRIVNFAGGIESAMSLRHLSDWCSANLGLHRVDVDETPRSIDIPMMGLDAAKAARLWNWRSSTPAPQILVEIAGLAEASPKWL